MKESLLSGAIVLAVLIVVGLVYAIVMSAKSDRRPDYCYVGTAFGSGPTTIFLFQHRPWAVDTKVQVVSSAEDAAVAARVIGCPLR